MKKITSLLLGLVLIVSCSSDDSSSSDDTSVAGTYILSSVIPSLAIDADANGSFDKSNIANLINCDFRLVLSDDNTYSLNYDAFSVSQTAACCPIQLDPITCQAVSTSGTYTVTDGSLVLTPGEGSLSSGQKILAISGNTVTFNTTSNFYAEINGVVDTDQDSIQLVASFVK